MNKPNLVYISWSIFVTGLSHAIDIRETDCILTKHKIPECVKQSNSSLSMWTDQNDIQALWLEITAFNPDIHCMNLTLELYQNALSCITAEMKECLDLAGMADIQPHYANMTTGYQTLCHQLDNFDAKCYSKQFPLIVKCGQWVTDAYVAGKELYINDIICIFNDAIYDCAEHLFQTCSNNTSLLYLEQREITETIRFGCLSPYNYGIKHFYRQQSECLCFRENVRTRAVLTELNMSRYCLAPTVITQPTIFSSSSSAFSVSRPQVN